MFSRFVGRLFRLFAPLSIPAALVGLILLIFPETAYAGSILLYSAAGVVGTGLLFQILTISVEYHASRIAINLLRKYEILNEKELKQASRFMNSAGFTYVADFFATILGINLIRRKMRRAD
jgi:Zn-dependent membrane protease YugP